CSARSRTRVDPIIGQRGGSDHRPTRQHIAYLGGILQDRAVVVLVEGPEHFQQPWQHLVHLVPARLAVQLVGVLVGEQIEQVLHRHILCGALRSALLDLHADGVIPSLMVLACASLRSAALIVSLMTRKASSMSIVMSRSLSDMATQPPAAWTALARPAAGWRPTVRCFAR